MNYIKEMENKLKNYKLIEHSIRNMKREILDLSNYNSPCGIGAMQLDETGVRNCNRKEVDTLNAACEIIELRKAREAAIKEIKKINANLNYISRELGCENYGKLLRLWYIGIRDEDTGEYEKLTVEGIAEELGYSRASKAYIYEKKDDALNKLAIAYWGVVVNN